MKLVTMALASLMAAPVLLAQRGPAHPLGVTFGMSLAALRHRIRLTPVEGQPYVYSSTTAPTPSGAFKVYMYTVTPKHGLCIVTAGTAPVVTDAGGDEARRQFDYLRETLETKYGKSFVTDELSPNAVWRTPNAWVLALEHDERTLRASWGPPGTIAHFTDLYGVTLNASSTSSSSVFFEVMYLGTESAECADEIKAAQAGVL